MPTQNLPAAPRSEQPDTPTVTDISTRKPPQRAPSHSQLTADPLSTVDDVARRLNVSKDWVWDHSSRKTPLLPVIRMGDGTLRYRQSEIEAFIENEKDSPAMRRASKMEEPTVFPHRNRGADGYLAPDGFGRPAWKGLVWLLPQGSDRSYNRRRPIRSRLRPARPKITDDKAEARDALRRRSPSRRANSDGRILKDGTVTFEWFVRNRYFPLRQGDWRPETAKEKTAQIEIDLIAKFGSRTA